MDKETIMQLLADGVISNEVATKYFPDLKESRDERIRQFLIEFVRYYMVNNCSDNFSKEDCLAWLEGHGEQKPAVWSEDDEIRYKTTLDDLEAFLGYIKQKSSREITKYSLESKDGILITTQRNIAWVKSIKERIQPQNTWKPSDEQMHYLSWIANIKLGDGVVEQEVSKHLNELYQDLLKLKG